MNREIADSRHSTIRDADQLWIYSYREQKFRIIDRSEFPKPKGSKCFMCPNGARKSRDSTVCCSTKVETWAHFKSHLVTVEKIFGELIAFPADCKEEDLPPIRNYTIKHRAYGHLVDYQEADSFYLYDVKKENFVYVQRNMMSKLYSKSNTCVYCPCSRKITSPSSIINHIQAIENKYFCFLILDNEEQNDRRNQEKIMNFVNSIQSSFPSGNQLDHTNYRTEEILEQTNDLKPIKKLNQNFHYCHNSLSLLDEMECDFKKECQRLESYFHQMRKKVNISSLRQNLINQQEKLILTKRIDNTETKEKNLTFTKKLKLDSTDLAYLMKQCGVPRSYEITNAEINLNIALKPIEKNSLSNDLVNCSGKEAGAIETTDETKSFKIYTGDDDSLNLKHEPDVTDKEFLNFYKRTSSRISNVRSN